MRPIVTAKQLIKRLQEIVKAEGDLPVIYAKDDEGNGYDAVLYSAGVMDGGTELGNYDGQTITKAICIN